MKMIATTALILTAGIFNNAASAADPHLDDLAFTLKQQAALACQEVRYGFRRTPAFPHLYRDFYELYTLADHMHDVAHHHGDLRHLKDDAEQLDAHFHHAEELIAQFGKAPRNVSGYHFRRLQAVMLKMEDTIHHLQEDLDAELSPGGVVPPLPPGQIGGPALAPPIDPGLAPSTSRFPKRAVPPSRSIYRGRLGDTAFSIRIGR